MFKFNKKISVPIIVVILLFSIITPLLLVTPTVYAVDAPTKAQVISSMKGWCDANDEITSYASIGKTSQNNDIWQFKIGTNDSYKIMLDGALHGMEGGGTMACYYLAQWLLSGNETANYFLENAQFILIPIINYDRCSMPAVGDSTYRKNANGTYPLGTDLNRNFVNGWSYSSDPTSNYYSGGTAASQNETKALRANWVTEQPDVYINFHDFGGDNTLDGWLLFYAGDAAYQENINNIFGSYAAFCTSLGMTAHKKTFNGALGSAKDDAYVLIPDGDISVNWEITCPNDDPWGHTTFDRILYEKLPHIILFCNAIVKTLDAGGDAPPALLYDGFEDGFSPLWTAQWSLNGTITTAENNPHHGSYSLSATTIGGQADKYAVTYKNVTDLTASPIHMRAMNVNFNNRPLTEGYAMHCFAGSLGEPWGISALAYFGILKNATHWNYYIRAMYTGTTFQNYVSTVQPAANDTVEVALYRGTSSNGYALLYVNENLVVNASGLDNDARAFMYVHAGAVFSDAAATDSTITMDCVELNTVYIGPEAETPVDSTAPTYSDSAYSGAMAGRVCTFSAAFEDETSLNRTIFSLDNGVGYYTNMTETALDYNPDNATFQVTLNSTVGVTVNSKWYVSDSSGNWNTTSEISFTTTGLNQTEPFLKWANTKRVDSDFSDYLSGGTFDFSGYYTGLYTKFLEEIENTNFGPAYLNRTVDYGSPSYTVGEPITDWSAIADYTCNTYAEAATAFSDCTSGDIIYLVNHINVTSRLTMTSKSNILIVGNGWNNTSLDLADNVNSQTMYFANCTNIVVRDLLVSANRIHNLDVGSMGALAFYGGANCTVENVRVVGARRDGIYMSDGTGQYIVNSVADDAGWNGHALARCTYSGIAGVYAVDCSDVNINLWTGNNQVIVSSVSDKMVLQGLGAADSAVGIGLEVQVAAGYDLYNVIVRQCLSTGIQPNTLGNLGDGLMLLDGNAYSDSYNIIFDNNNASFNNHCGLQISVPSIHADRNETIVVVNNQLHDNDMTHRDVWYVDDFVTYRANITTVLTEAISSIFGSIHGIPIDEWGTYRGIPIGEINIRDVT